jgi:hypothetical protein
MSIRKGLPDHIVLLERLKEVEKMTAVAGGAFTSTGAILVLFILLVIISRTVMHGY